MLVVAVARVGAWDVGDGVGMLWLVLTVPVVGVAGWVGVGASLLWLALTAPVMGVAGWAGVGAGLLWLVLTAPVVGVVVVGGGVLTWIFSSPHRSNPVSSTTLDTDSVGASSRVTSATVFGHTFDS